MGFLFGLFGSLRPKKRFVPLPDVVVDFKLIKGQFFLSIVNFSEAEARDIRVTFLSPLKCFNGSKSVDELDIFSVMPYLPPFKEIDIFLDPVDVFFYHLKDPNLTIHITYKDEEKCEYEKTTTYNLNVYKGHSIHTKIAFLDIRERDHNTD